MFKFNFLFGFVAQFNIAKTLILKIPNQTTVKPAKWNFSIFLRNPAFQVFSLCCRLLILDIIRLFKIERYFYIILFRNGFIENKIISILYLKNIMCDSSKKFSVKISVFIGLKNSKIDVLKKSRRLKIKLWESMIKITDFEVICFEE